MIYSCLVDADFLDTEKFLEPEKFDWRKGYPSLDVLERNLRVYMDDLVNRASPTKLNEERKDIFENCLKAAELGTRPFLVNGAHRWRENSLRHWPSV